MVTKSHYAYLTYHYFGPENYIGSGFTTCKMGSPSKNWAWEEMGGTKT